MAARMILIATDEAGYGPEVGPTGCCRDKLAGR